MQNVFINVEPNIKYRFRILNTASDTYFNFAIGNHNLTVIQQGQCPVVEVVFKSLDVSSGQRYDFIVQTLDQKKENFQV
jgi:iron transport multicopper oxidase